MSTDPRLAAEQAAKAAESQPFFRPPVKSDLPASPAVLTQAQADAALRATERVAPKP